MFASDFENIYAFGEAALKWEFNLRPYQDEYNSAPPLRPAVCNSTIYTTIINAGQVLAIDAKTGALKWIYSFMPGQEPMDKEYFIRYDSTFPAVSKGTVILIARVEYMEKIVPVAIEPGAEDLNTPALDKTTFPQVFALNASNGVEIWNYSINMDSGLSGRTPFIYNDLVYFGLDDEIVTRSLGTGRPIWSTDVSCPHICC